MKQILLIENDSDVRDIMTYILEDLQFHVLHGQLPFEEMQTLNVRPDLIIIDEWIAGEPGSRLCHRIKHFDQLHQVPVIIISTAHHIEEIMADCGADDFIRKPFDLKELTDKVKQQLY